MATEILSSVQRDSAADWPAQHSAWARSFEALCKTVFKIYCPLTIHGTENLPEVPYLICSNHVSHLDSTMLMAGLGLPFSQIGLIAAKDYFFDTGHLSYLRNMMNLVPIARGSGTRALKDSIMRSRQFLESGGKALIIYPEGTRSLSGKIGRFKEGAAMLAHELDLPMVPACVKGSFRVLPKGAYFIRPGKISVHFGAPLKVSDMIVTEPGQPIDRKVVFHAFRDATVLLEKRVRAMAEGSPHDR